MAAIIRRKLHGLASTRDLRAEMVALASELVGNKSRGVLQVREPVLDKETVWREWQRARPVLAPEIRDRLGLDLEPKASDARRETALAVSRPRYRYEVLRQLLAAYLRDEAIRIPQVVAAVGASQTPVYAAVDALSEAGIVRTQGRAFAVAVADLSTELLARLGALPQTLRFRYERGAKMRAPAALARRAIALLRKDGPPDWRTLALSGVPVAHADVRSIDTAGSPRVDLVWQPGRDATSFDAALMRQLDDGLEPEPNPLAAAPVVVTVARAATPLLRAATVNGARAAHPADVALALIDLGLRRQAMQYAEALRG